jgi:hypothetical protein
MKRRATFRETPCCAEIPGFPPLFAVVQLMQPNFALRPCRAANSRGEGMIWYAAGASGQTVLFAVERGWAIRMRQTGKVPQTDLWPVQGGVYGNLCVDVKVRNQLCEGLDG